MSILYTLDNYLIFHQLLQIVNMFVLTTEQNISLITMSIPPTPALLQEIRTQFR